MSGAFFLEPRPQTVLNVCTLSKHPPGGPTEENLGIPRENRRRLISGNGRNFALKEKKGFKRWSSENGAGSDRRRGGHSRKEKSKEMELRK